MRRICAGLLAAAVLISGCTGGTRAEPSGPRTFDLGEGAQLVAPAGALPDGVQLHGEPVTDPLIDLPELPSAGSIEVTTTAQPDEPVTVEIPVDPAAYADLPAEADDTILVAHKHADEPWEPLLGQLDRDRGVVSVTTDRLSKFDVRLPSLSALRESVGDILEGILGDIDFDAPKPSCTNEEEARAAGYTVTSTSKSVLRWCLGLRADGSPELKVVANRRYPLVLTHAPAFTVRDTTPGELGVRLAQAATNALTTRQVTLSPAGTTTFDVAIASGQSQRMVAEYDGFAQAMTTAAMMAQSVVTIASWAGGRRAAKEFMDATINAAACAPALLDLADDVTDNDRIGAMFSACFDPDAIRSELGKIAGHIILSFASFLGSVVAYVWDGATTIVDQVRGDSSYTIIVERANAPTPAAGTGCDTDLTAAAVCRVVRALVAGDLSGLGDRERAAVTEVTTVPTTSWAVDSCEAVGDISAQCLVLFDPEPGALRGTKLTFSVQPVNGTYDAKTGRYDVPAGEDIALEVTSFDGYGS